VKRLEEAPIEGIGGVAHGLEPPGAVYVGHCRDHGPFLRPHGVYLNHEGVRDRSNKVLLKGLFEDRWGKGPELFTELDLCIDDLAHIGPSWVGQDAPVTEGPCPPLHPPLKPADDFSLCDALRRPPAEFRFSLDLPHPTPQPVQGLSPRL